MNTRTITEPTVDTIISCRFVTFQPLNLCGYGDFSFVYEPPIENALKMIKSRIIVGLLVLDQFKSLHINNNRFKAISIVISLFANSLSILLFAISSSTNQIRFTKFIIVTDCYGLIIPHLLFHFRDDVTKKGTASGAFESSMYKSGTAALLYRLFCLIRIQFLISVNQSTREGAAYTLAANS